MNGLHTDLYQLTMAAGFFEAGKATERATFELFVRRLPAHRDFLICAGLAQAVEYLLNLQFTGEQIDYLRTLPQFENVSEPGAVQSSYYTLTSSTRSGLAATCRSPRVTCRTRSKHWSTANS